MHEMSLCESILSIIDEQAKTQNFSRVKTVWLEIGALAGVEIEAMRFGFDVVTKGSVADGAKLVIVEIPGKAWCMQCSKNVIVKQKFDACPECGGFHLQIIAGDEMRIKELEVN